MKGSLAPLAKVVMSVSVDILRCRCQHLVKSTKKVSVSAKNLPTSQPCPIPILPTPMKISKFFEIYRN